MRPTTGTMLQQNNNNNYPCLNMSDCPQEMLQKVSRASLPFPSRVELGLGDLPLIRGLRAWALCSKNRRKAGGLLGGGKPPTAPPLARGTSMSCPRPADVYLSGYGLPLGLDARQAGIGALVTVATLKTSEGSGKTQTQCLFLRTEKGSCLYSTAKPSSGASPSMVGEWLRGKRGGGEGGGGADPPSAEAGANRVRVRSGRRWRKSGNTAGRERKAVSRERQQRSCKRIEPREVKQEEQDKGRLDGKQFPCLQLDNSRGGGCNSVSPKTCTPKSSWDECDGGESPARGAGNELSIQEEGATRERQRNDEDGGVSNAVLDASNPDRNRNTNRTSDDQEIRRGEGVEELKALTSLLPGDLTRRDEEANNGMSGTHESSREFMVTPSHRKPENETKQETEQETNKEMECPPLVFITQTKESSHPAEGSVCSTDQDTFWVYANQNQLKVELGPEGEDKCAVEEETNICNLQPLKPNSAADESNTVNKETTGNNSQQEEKGILCSPVRQRDLSVYESLEGRIGNLEEECTCSKLHDGSRDEEEQRSRASADNCSLASQEPGRKKEGDTSTCVETNGQKPTVVCNGADPPTSNPAPSLASMVTGLPCLEVEAEKEEVVGHGGGGHKQSRSPRGELEEKAEEVRSSTVATEEGRNEEEEDEFGVFMQAEGEAAWSEGVNMSASVPCRSRGSTGIGKHSNNGEDDWTAFPQDPTDESRDAVKQWWPASAVEAWRDGSPANHSLAAVFADAFPSLPSCSPGDSCDLEAVPTLTRLLRDEARQEQGLLDSFHDLNKMIGQSNRRSNSASQNLLLKTLQLQQPLPESRPTSWTSSRRLSPGLSSANQHSAAKRRLSYDYNRNVVE
ncbi:uncharacterized protein si:ch211-14c7.2 [Cyprinodon tularosa]|uniref:uncharacterized protein si:ch211-14c7.2 n=1 Tax=Cyprinodon tularosa TaxID=77115 RepID=UPI0018E22406|nr:uncharacterized protein si:ch211-14c7.2 [Cyprinodon tularosa]